MSDKATAEQRAIVRRAIHSVFTHLNREDIKALLIAQESVNYAGAQLGTSSQARACSDKGDLVCRIVADMSPFYIREMARYVSTGKAGLMSDD